MQLALNNSMTNNANFQCYTIHIRHYEVNVNQLDPCMDVTGEPHLLFPMSMMTMLALECCLASSNHEVRCSNVSRLCTQTHTPKQGHIRMISTHIKVFIHIMCAESKYKNYDLQVHC